MPHDVKYAWTALTLSVAAAFGPAPDILAGEPSPPPAEAGLADRLAPPVSGLAPGESGSSTPFDLSALSSASSPPGAPQEKKKDGEFFVAPLPFANPTLGWGLGAMAGYIFRVDPDDTISPPTLLGVTGFYAENGSWGGGLGGMTYLDEDRWRLMGGLAAGRMRFDFSGVGAEAGRENGSLPLDIDFRGFLLQGMGRVVPHMYAGLRGLFGRITTRVDTTDLGSPAGGFLSGKTWASDDAALGLRLQVDTRDSTFYPTRGVLLDIICDLHNKALGDDFNYEIEELSANGYIRLAEGHVLALRGYGRYASADAPFFALSFLGRGADLRGYAVGQYQDRLLLDVQAEYRVELGWRLGATAFAGIGTVAPNLGDIDGGDLFPSGGVGLRYTVAPENHVNLRTDFAWGKEGFVFYLGVGEAF